MLDEKVLIKTWKIVAKRYGADLAQDVAVKLLERFQAPPVGLGEPVPGNLVSYGLQAAKNLKINQDRAAREGRIETLLADVSGVELLEAPTNLEQRTIAKDLIEKCDPDIRALYAGEPTVISRAAAYRLRTRVAANDYETGEEVA